MKQNYLRKNLLLWILAFLMVNFVTAQIPSYYSGTNISATGESLKNNLGTLVTNTQHTVLSYTPGVWEALKQTDLDPANPNNVFLLYGYNDSDADVTNDRTRSKDNNGGGSGQWNREHTYPKSLGNPNLGTTGPGSDAHHLRATDVQFNATRSNRPYIDSEGTAKALNNGFYPGDEWKGDVARMMMYMYIRYGDRCLPNTVGLGNSTYSPEMRDLFLEWNAEDPVSQVEINRNVLLEGIQGNRNPFIDNPAFATTIWGGPQAEDRFQNTSTDIEAPTVPANLVAANATITGVDLSWSASTDNVAVLAYQIFNGTNVVTATSSTSFTVSGLVANTTYSFSVKAIDAAGNSSSESNTVTFTTLEDTATPPTPTGDFIAFQGYENSVNDTWTYVQSPVPCNTGGDVWDIVSNVGSITGPKSGANFFGIQDLEGNCATVDGGTLTFNAIDISNYTGVTLSFEVQVDGFDVANGDVLTYEIFHDAVSQGVVTITVGSPYSTSGWEQISQAVPDTVSSVSLQLYAKQNGGSDYAGFDDVQLQGTAVGSGSSDQGLLINEIDADQESTDASEFIELYDGGSGNTSLDGYLVVLYNGSNNLSYNTIDLSGYATDENGYFVIGSANVANVDLAAFTTNGIQNGADAVALYLADAANFSSGTELVLDETLVDAVVYGTSDGDDVELLALLNSGQAQVDENEGGNGTVNSMQRSPNGQGGARNTNLFVMKEPTPGTSNGGGDATTDTEVPTIPAQVTTTTIEATKVELSWVAATDNVGVTEYQIFEGTTLVGTTAATTFSVEGLSAATVYSFTVVAIDAAGNSSALSEILSVTTSGGGTSPTGALLITGVYDGPLTGGIPKGVELYATADIADLSSYSLGSANNGGGTNGEEFTFPAVAVAQGEFIYVATEEVEFNAFFGFMPTFTDDAMAINGDDAVELFQNGMVIDVFGAIDVDGSGQVWEYTDGWAYRNENTGPDGATFVSSNWTFSGPNALDTETTNATAGTPFPVASYTVSGPAQIVINEVDVDNIGTDALEFIELYDGGNGNSSLDGLVLVLYNGSNDLSYNAIDLTGYTTNENGYFVIGSSAVANVSLEAFTTNGIQNGADAVALYAGTAADFPSGTPVLVNDVLLDALVYGTDDGDDEGLLVLLNSGEAQVNEAALGDKDSQSMQRMPNGAGGARNTSSYTTAIPSPGTANGAVIPAPATISILAARNTAEGDVVTVSGVLTVSDQLAGSAYIQDATAAIAIFDTSVHGAGNFMIGDSITVTGTRSAFNDQVQISTVTQVEHNGTPNVAITPQVITLAELGNHPAELVTILNPSFPKAGDILFGNSNYTLSDASGFGDLRIDNDVEAIVGLGQPASCSEITGVVGRFFESYQLLPRAKADMPCATAYVPLDNGVAVGKDKTFDVVAWNIEWFGDETNSPAVGNPLSDAIQKDSVLTILRKMDADVYTVEEISDDVLFGQMVSEMNGYDYVLSEAVSYPNDATGTQQKVGFIYNTATVSVVATKPLLASIHPYYNGGDDTALSDYPDTDKTRFYASGRLPFLMTADVTLAGVTKRFDMVALHARANSSSGPQSRYDMRKYDVEVLKDTLDAQFADANLIVLGDYNDDVDFTVADEVSSTVSTFDAYVQDTVNYKILTKVLSEGDYRSYVFRENMIDHITVSDELSASYIDGSVSVGYEFYDTDYTTTVSDHFPVSARFILEELQITEVVSSDITCSGEAATATVQVSGGIAPYAYAWNDGQTTATATDLSSGSYSVIVTDATGTTVQDSIYIETFEPIEFTVTDTAKVFYGYEAEACATIGVTSTWGGVAPYTYSWSSGEDTESITVCPNETTLYTVTITDVNGCTVSGEITVEVEDVSCGNNYRRPKVSMCKNGRTICVSERAVEILKRKGYTLGSCAPPTDNPDGDMALKIYPNPFTSYAIVQQESTEKGYATYIVYDYYGSVVYKSYDKLRIGTNKSVLPLWYLCSGYYVLKTYVNGNLKSTEQIIKK